MPEAACHCWQVRSCKPSRRCVSRTLCGGQGRCDIEIEFVQVRYGVDRMEVEFETGRLDFKFQLKTRTASLCYGQ